MNDRNVAALVREVEAAWNTHDMTRFAACFAVDADFVNVGGMWWRGRSEIEQRHSTVHAGPFRASVLTQELAAFREIGSGVGVAHVGLLKGLMGAAGSRWPRGVWPTSCQVT